ncbi:sensor histidine kinase [Petroclostridium sp. X23]|uniref:cache domain-containing sensor histidine kinase n=1 Tax=Petroclostridium sp. X23 TaxID=3045146 RepID=UPI0024AD00D1|nr:sensor histidine kinase [Petroclostridium sp. X23]WHH59094.1 sensor histidine kinase [Petroclostridium sp. X23]
MNLKRYIKYKLKRTFIPFHIKLSISHILISILPICIIYFISYNIYSNSILSETSDRMTSVIMQASEDVEDIFHSMTVLLMSIPSSTKIKEVIYNPRWITETPDIKKMEDYQSVNDAFYGILYLRTDIASVRLVPFQGASIIYFENGVLIGYPHPFIPWLREIFFENGREVFISPHKTLAPSNIKTNVFSVAKAFKDRNGRIVGTIMVDAKVDEINTIIDNAGSINKTQVAILDTEGSIIFNSSNLQYVKRLDDQLLSKIQGSPSGTLRHIINGEDYLVIHKTSEVSGWKFVAFSKINSLLEKTHKVKTIVLTVGFFAFSFSVILSIVIAIKVTTPLKNLNISMDGVTDRNFDVYLRPTSNDEIGKLTRNFNSMIRRIKNLIVKKYEADIRRKQAELKALESQINPHFLYNTLETISSIAYLKDVPEIMTISRSLSDLFRYSINNEKKLVTLGDELYHTANYINIQKIRHGNKFNVCYNIPEEAKKYNVIKLILQPIIENSINHGLELIKLGGIIKVSAHKSLDNMLIIEVEDNGIGIPHEKLKRIQADLNRDSAETYETSGSIGLANVHFRIKHYYGNNYGLTIESTDEKGCKVILKLPITEDRKEI